MTNKKRLGIGDPVVYQDPIYPAYNKIGIVTETSTKNLKVLWDGEENHRTEIYERLRHARLDEVDAHTRIIKEHA